MLPTNRSNDATQRKDALGALRESNFTSSLRMNDSLQRSWRPWPGLQAFETLFEKIDSDSDGLISWDDVLQLAVEEATQSITVMTEGARSYFLSRVSPRTRLVQTVHTLPEHKSMFAVVSRAEPLVLLSKKDFSVVKEFSMKDLGNNHPRLVEYMPIVDVLLAYTINDKTVRGWWNVVSKNRMGTFSPLYIGDSVRRIRTQQNIFPYSFFTCGSHGNVVRWQVPKQRSVQEISRAHSYEALHSPESGGITDFALTDESIFSTGFDRRLLSTNLETGRSILIGLPHDTIRFVEYNRNYACLPTVSYSNRVLLWDVRSSAVMPGVSFGNGGTKPHTADVIGLCSAPGLPQIITCDSAGLMKVWDLRTLQCSQTLYADGSALDEVNVDCVCDDKASNLNGESFAFRNVRKGDTHSIRSFGAFPHTQEVVCGSAGAIYCLRYNHRCEGHIADVECVQSAFYDPRQGTILLQGAARTSVWDAAEGFRRRVFDRAIHANTPYWRQEVFAVCLDYPRNRLFFAISGGVVELRSSKDFAVLETFSMHKANAQAMLYSTKHRLLVSIAVNGSLTLRQEMDSELSVSTIGLSTNPLRALSLSEEAGIIVCCDERALFFLDYKQTKLCHVTVALTCPLRTTAVLGTFPVVATSSNDGELTLWSMPPAEESYTPLVSFFFGRSSSELGRSGTEMRVPLLGSPSLARQQVGRVSSPTSHVVCVAEPCEESANGKPAASPAILGKREKKKSGFTDLLDIIAADDRANGASTAISFDDVSHRLFLADQKGRLFIYSCCNFLQEFGIRHCSFENRTRYQLQGMGKGFQTSQVPIFLQVVSVHKGPTTFMAWFPEISAVISCGSDYLVKILDRDGTTTGELVMDRLPPKLLSEEVDGLGTRIPTEKKTETSLMSFALPYPLSTSAPCLECARIEKELRNRRYSSMVETHEEPPQLPAVNRCQVDSAVSLGKRDPSLAKEGAFLVSAAEDANEIQSKELSLPSPVSDRLVALEEKKQWRPLREEARAFREKEYDLTTRPTCAAGDAVADQDAAVRRSHPTSAEPKAPPDAWWKPLSLPTTTPATPKEQVRAPVCPHNNNVNNTKNITNSGGGCRNTPSPAAALGGGLSLSGISVSPPRLAPTKPPEVAVVVNSGLPLEAMQKERRGRGRGFLRMREKKTRAAITASRPVNTTEAGNEEGAEPFLDSVLRKYEKELHRCVRGRGGMERLFHKTPTARLSNSTATRYATL
ncbi:uncharacterized protein Tco025E_05072 [Trypanosoma conorhini]|uniref:EF-hand domain-containing protein n=1 Tax=Trypanosoma conorhini TaxID=83891 RepID=A0A422PHH9_9TRYP|nr:uncharacterized protein Tco025E_05072 [Trypanosoma conorhini]RNF17143.1 hypothetical protein Tco025E_05072 [Trypanosoma conorhini]